MKDFAVIRAETQQFVAGKAKPRHRGPSRVEQRLANRQGGFRATMEGRGGSTVNERAFHKPGSRNRHKV